MARVHAHTHTHITPRAGAKVLGACIEGVAAFRIARRVGFVRVPVTPDVQLRVAEDLGDAARVDTWYVQTWVYKMHALAVARNMCNGQRKTTCSQARKYDRIHNAPAHPRACSPTVPASHGDYEPEGEFLDDLFVQIQVHQDQCIHRKSIRIPMYMFRCAGISEYYDHVCVWGHTGATMFMDLCMNSHARVR